MGGNVITIEYIDKHGDYCIVHEYLNGNEPEEILAEYKYMGREIVTWHYGF